MENLTINNNLNNRHQEIFMETKPPQNLEENFTNKIPGKTSKLRNFPTYQSS